MAEGAAGSAAAAAKRRRLASTTQAKFRFGLDEQGKPLPKLQDA